MPVRAVASLTGASQESAVAGRHLRSAGALVVVRQGQMRRLVPRVGPKGTGEPAQPLLFLSGPQQNDARLVGQGRVARLVFDPTLPPETATMCQPRLPSPPLFQPFAPPLAPQLDARYRALHR